MIALTFTVAHAPPPNLSFPLQSAGAFQCRSLVPSKDMGSNPGLPHCGQILYQLSHKGSPRTLAWVPIPSPAELPKPGIELGSPALQADSLSTELSGKPVMVWKLAIQTTVFMPLEFGDFNSWDSVSIFFVWKSLFQILSSQLYCKLPLPGSFDDPYVPISLWAL